MKKYPKVFLEVGKEHIIHSRLFLTMALGFLCVSFLFAGAAQALTLTPDDADFWGDDTSTSVIVAILANDGYTPEVYKQNVGGLESGDLGSYLTTTFTDTPLDPMNAEIVVDSTLPYIPELLLVKDGNQSPAWYAFLLDDWNGSETIVLNGFWPNQGSISHVAMYGSAPVPEPATLLLLGTGLLGLAGATRRKLKK